jgi:hypothetical protein
MAERALATAYVTIIPSFKGFKEEFDKSILPSTEDSGKKSGDRFNKGFGSSLSKIKNVFLGAVVGGAVANFTKDLIAAGEAEVSSNRKLENVTKSMGLFGDHAGDVAKRLEELSGVQQLQLGIDDDTIKSTQIKLLTFANLAKTAGVAGGMFDRASLAAQDLAAAGFGSAETNAVQLGKALQDPVKGITALARSGVTFTEQEKIKIETLVKSGKLLDAQNMVLGAIETQVGGTAAAGVTASDKMQQGFNQIKETLGLALLPTFNKLGDYISTKFIPYVKDFIERFKQGKTALNPVFDAIKGFVGFMITYKDFLLPIVAGIVAVVAAFKTYTAVMKFVTMVTTLATAAQTAFDVVLTANPIGLIVVAIAALIAGLVLFFTKTTIGKAILQGFFDYVKVGFALIKGLAIDFANVFVDGLNLIIHGINLFIRAWNLIPGHTDIKTIGTIGNIDGGLTPTSLTAPSSATTVTTSPKATSQAQHRGTGTGGTLIYNAAPNNSLDSHKDLVTAVERSRTRTFS